MVHTDVWMARKEEKPAHRFGWWVCKEGTAVSISGVSRHGNMKGTGGKERGTAQRR